MFMFWSKQLPPLVSCSSFLSQPPCKSSSSGHDVIKRNATGSLVKLELPQAQFRLVSANGGISLLPTDILNSLPWPLNLLCRFGEPARAFWDPGD